MSVAGAFAGRPGVVIETPLSVREAGFSLHAATRAGPADERRREALLKYILRPPLANERLLQGPNGLVRTALKKPSANLALNERVTAPIHGAALVTRFGSVAWANAIHPP